MSVRSGQSITADFTTSRFDTGAATVADSLPTGTLVVNGTDDAATVTVTSKTGGKYKAAVTLPTLAIGDVVQIRIAATVNSVAGIGVIWTDTKDLLIDANGKTTDAVQTGDSFSAIAALNNVSAAQVNTQCASAISSAALATASNLATVAGYLDTEIADIKAKTDNLPSDPAGASVIAGLIAAIPSAPTAAANAAATRTELATELARIDAAISSRSTYAGADTSGTTTLLSRVTGAVMLASSYTAPPTAAQNRAEMDSNSTRLAAIVADTDELQTDWHNGGRLESLLQTAAEASVGTGARLVTITVDDGSDPIENATVRLSNGGDSFRQLTDVSGECVFAVDDATWSVRITKSRYTFSPTSLVVDGDETATYSMTTVAITPSDPGFVTGFLQCYDSEGLPDAGVAVSMQMQRAPNANGSAFDSSVRTETSDSEGLVEFANLVKGARYSIYRGTTPRQPLVILIASDATDPVELPNVIGRP